MANKLWFVLVFLLDFVVGLVLCADAFSRHDFPLSPQFVFGAGTSAGQYEGAAFEDGRTPSSWDTYAHTGITQGATGDIACDGYHKYKEDVQLMVETGLEAYRFSISWSRLIPNGRGPVNLKGLEYYNNVINELVKHGIQPHVTLNHLDFPQVLEDEYGGWISPKIIKDFTAYADVCFREFGDRVSHWTTVNEPNLVAWLGYDIGLMPPQRCSLPYGIFNCSAGNSSVEPYVAAHNILLAHASVSRLYKKKYQVRQHGLVGINLYASWPVPHTNSAEDVIAAQRYNDFFLGWFLDPLVYGDYPAVMKKNAGARLPAFTEAESRLVKGSCDFVGVNHYYVISVKDGGLFTDREDFIGDLAVEFFNDPVGGAGDESPPTPSGLFELLGYLKRFYGGLPVYVYENGRMEKKNVTSDDPGRVEYLQVYIGSLLDALRNGSTAVGYFYWSFIDLYEVVYGYEASYGLYHVDFDGEDLSRTPKMSAHWYGNFLKGNNTSLNSVVEADKEIGSQAVLSQ